MKAFLFGACDSHDLLHVSAGKNASARCSAGPRSEGFGTPVTCKSQAAPVAFVGTDPRVRERLGRISSQGLNVFV